MRQLIDRLAPDSAKREKPARKTLRKRSALTLESLESRELFTVSVTPVYAVTNSWNTGFQADLRLENHQTATVPNWTLEFDLGANITSIWNAKVTGHAGNHYTIVGASWNNSISAGGAIDFGFVANGAAGSPSGYRLNGNALGPNSPALPNLSIGDVTLTEGASGTINAVFTVSLSSAAADAVLVNFATSDGSASGGSDYRPASGTLTFAPGERNKSISVAVLGDLVVEADENFFVDVSNARGAQLAKSRGTGLIANDDVPQTPANGNVQFAVTSDWGSGFTAQMTLKNSGAAAITNWQLEFDYGGTITSIWDAKVVNHTGNHYVISNAGYNSTIPAGASLAFGFNGSPGGTSAAPTNFVLKSGNGSGGGGGSTSTNHAPVAADDFASTSPGQALLVNVLANDSDPDGDALVVALAGQAAHGTVALQADNTVRYTPTAGFTGTDSFAYTLRDTKGATSTANVSITVAAVGDWPAHVFAPYVDMTLYPMYNLVTAAQSQGIRYFSLAFVVADSRGMPSWGGYSEYALGSDFDAQMKTQIAGVRGLGGDVVVSFGGASGQELAQAITDVTALKNAYQSVINAYGLTHIDFDIEGAASADHASIDRRNQAIAGLQRDAALAGRVLDVSYTLPVLPAGLTPDGLYVLQSALRYGVNIGNVNIMAMDYGDSAAPNPQGKMGDYAIAAATSLFSQLQTLYSMSKTESQLWGMIGVTPMIGLNDVTTETFDQQEARELMAFAQQKGIGRIAMWSLNRDQQNTAGKLSYVDLKSSSIVQQPFEFVQIFRSFTA
jgi:hypothetical protein